MMMRFSSICTGTGASLSSVVSCQLSVVRCQERSVGISRQWLADNRQLTHYRFRRQNGSSREGGQAGGCVGGFGNLYLRTAFAYGLCVRSELASCRLCL